LIALIRLADVYSLQEYRIVNGIHGACVNHTRTSFSLKVTATFLSPGVRNVAIQQIYGTIAIVADLAEYGDARNTKFKQREAAAGSPPGTIYHRFISL
jgi:hypothetical protein